MENQKTGKESKKLRFFCREDFWYILLTVGFYFHNLIYLYLQKGKLLNSDASAEMILANHLNKVGGFLSKDWFYSSELRVLNTQFIYKLGLLFFPHNWHMARTFSVGLFMLILIAAGWYLMWAVGRKEKGFLLGAILICPIGQWYAWNVIYNSYYVPHIVISLLSIAMFCHVFKSDNRILRIILSAALILLSFGAGLGGVRQVMVCYIPFFVSVLLLFLVDLWKKKSEGLFGAKAVFLSFGMMLAGMVGYFMNSHLLANIYTFKDYTETQWLEFSISSIWLVLEQLIRQFAWVPYVKVMSFTGVVNLLGIILEIVLFLAFLFLLKNFGKLRREEKLLMTFVGIAFGFMLFVFAETFVYNASYWLPILPFLFLPLILLIRVDWEEQENADRETVNKWEKHKPAAAILVFLFSLILCTVSSDKNPYVNIVPNDLDILNAAQWLKNQDEYTEGIAEFWSAPVVTELTDGKIEMWSVENYDQLKPYEWLQEKSHLEYPEGKVFVLMPAGKAAENPYRTEELKNNEIYNDGKYIIYGFNHYMEYFAGGSY